MKIIYEDMLKVGRIDLTLGDKAAGKVIGGKTDIAGTVCGMQGMAEFRVYNSALS